ncbi:hypothetical protein ANO14919_088210 [Xylariales sp. No.14919]|nr:hypothetical protein ANO14919_088210 [Xylariales sp. No.14919]
MAAYMGVLYRKNGNTDRGNERIIMETGPVIEPKEFLHFMLNSRPPWGSERLPLWGAEWCVFVRNVFIQTARIVVNQRRDLSLWSLERPPCAKRIPGLPSWVPDYTVGEIPVKRSIYSKTQDGGLDARWGQWMSPYKSIRFSNNNGLIAQGVFIDRIVYVSPIFTELNVSDLICHLYKRPNGFGSSSRGSTRLRHF